MVNVVVLGEELVAESLRLGQGIKVVREIGNVLQRLDPRLAVGAIVRDVGRECERVVPRSTDPDIPAC